MECIYRVDSAYRMTMQSWSGPAAPTWLEAVNSEEIAKGIRVNRFDFVADTDLIMRGKGAAVFCVAVYIEGRGSMSLTDGAALAIEPGTTVLFHAPNAASGENRIRGGARFHCLDVRFSPKALEMLGAPLLSALVRSGSTDCSVQDTLLLSRPTPPLVATVARSIVACELQGQARRLYLQAKALEVLAHIVADAGDETDTAGDYAAFSRRDRDKIRAATQLLALEYYRAWTIPLLSRQVGLNERKLKQGFRFIVGSSIHKYLEDARMRAAARILSGDVSVTETALAVGYENLSHFAKRFRAHYGMLPSAWRKRA